MQHRRPRDNAMIGMTLSLPAQSRAYCVALLSKRQHPVNTLMAYLAGRRLGNFAPATGDQRAVRNAPEHRCDRLKHGCRTTTRKRCAVTGLAFPRIDRRASLLLPAEEQRGEGPKAAGCSGAECSYRRTYHSCEVGRGPCLVLLPAPDPGGQEGPTGRIIGDTRCACPALQTTTNHSK